MEDDLDYKVVLGLKKDLNILQDKMTKALESDNVGTYINLQKALVNSLNAIKELSNEYELMYSAYTTGENKQKQVAIWEQNSDGDIRNHKVWNVINTEDAIKLLNDSYKKLTDDKKHVVSMAIAGSNPKCDKYETFKSSIDYVVDNFSVENQITIPTSEINRCIGKTTYLVNKAIESNGLVVVNSKSNESYIRDFISKDVAVIRPHEIQMYDYSVPLYIDESVIWEDIKDFIKTHPYMRFKYCHMNQN